MTDNLAGKRILIVEDDYFIAADIKRALKQEGAMVLGPVGYLQDGLAIVDSETPDATVLDINLDGSSTFPIADRLIARERPCLFVTGYDAWSIPETYRGMPRIAKPFTTRDVVDRLGQMLTGVKH